MVSDLGLGSIEIMENNDSLLNQFPASIELKALVNIGVKIDVNCLKYDAENPSGPGLLCGFSALIAIWTSNGVMGSSRE